MPKYPILSKIVGAVEKEEAPLLSKLGQAAEEVELNPDTMQALRSAGATLEETAPLTASMAESMDLQKMQNLRDIAAASEAAKSAKNTGFQLVGEPTGYPYPSTKVKSGVLVGEPRTPEPPSYPVPSGTSALGTEAKLRTSKMGEAPGIVDAEVIPTTTDLTSMDMSKFDPAKLEEFGKKFNLSDPKVAAVLATGIVSQQALNKLMSSDAGKPSGMGGDGSIALGPNALTPFGKKPESVVSWSAAGVGHRAVGAGGVQPHRPGDNRAGKDRAREVRAGEV